MYHWQWWHGLVSLLTYLEHFSWFNLFFVVVFFFDAPVNFIIQGVSVLMNPGSDQGQNLHVWTHSLAPWATEASVVLIWCDLCPHNAVVSGILKEEINNIRAVTPGSTFHFQISYIAAAAPSSSALNITVSSVCIVRFLYSSGWRVAPGLFIHLTEDIYIS